MARALVEILGDSTSLKAALGSSTAALDKFSAEWKTQFSAMSDQTLRLAVAQDKLAASTARYGEGSTLAAAATLKYRRELESIEAAQKRTAAQQLAAVSSVGRGITTYLSAPLAIAGYEAIKMGVDFQQQMLLIQTQAGASADEVHNLTGEVLKLAPAVGMGPSELAKGLYHLESLGLRGAQAIDTLKISAIAAGMGMADLETTTTALGSVVVTGIKGAQDYQKAMATLIATVGAGNVRMEDLAGSLGNVAPAAAAAGITLPELGAAMATLTDRGFSAEEAATRLRMALALIQSPTPKATKALADMGVNAQSLAGILRGPNGLLKVLEILNQGIQRVGATRGNRDILAGFGGGRSGLGIQTLVQSLDQPISSYGQKLQDVQTGTQKTLQNTSAYMDSAAFKLHQDLADMQSDFTKAGEKLVPVALGIGKAADDITKAFGAMPGPVKEDIGIVVGLLAIGGPLMLAGSGVVKMIKGIQTAFGLLPAAATTSAVATEAQLAGVEASAGAASVEVGTLRTGLLGLGELGPLAIPITIAISYEIQKGFDAAKGRSFGVKYLSGIGQLAKSLGQEFPGVGAVGSAVQTIIGATAPKTSTPGQAVQTGQNNPFEPGGALNPVTLLKQHPGSVKTAGPSTPSPISKFVLPYKLQLEQSQAALTKSTADDVQAAKDVIAFAKTQIASGRLTHAAMLQALQEEGSALSTLWSVQTKASKAGVSAISHDSLLARARLDLAQGDTAAARTLLEQDKKRLEEELKQADTASKRLAITKQLTTVEKLLNSKQESFALSLSLQEQIARADALAALTTGAYGPTSLQIRLAKEAKAQAMKAIDSHTLTLQGLINAWQIVQQENTVLAQAQGAVDTYHAVSTRALTAGLKLTHDQRVSLEQRLAQSAAHRGYAPATAVAQGYATDVHVYTHDTDHLIKKIEKRTTHKGQRRSGRR